MKLLLVEDEEAIRAPLRCLLENAGWQVDTAAGVAEAREKLEQGGWDALLVDLGLPDGSGYTVCHAARRCSDAAVIILTARGDESSVVRGLDSGADDYVTKPFRAAELLGRLRAVQRRRGLHPAYRLGGLTVDTARACVLQHGREVALSATEYRLLLVFANNPRTVLTRERLLGELWDAAGEFVNDNTLTVYIKRLREKIENVSSQWALKTVWGVGYKFELAGAPGAKES